MRYSTNARYRLSRLPRFPDPSTLGRGDSSTASPARTRSGAPDQDGSGLPDSEAAKGVKCEARAAVCEESPAAPRTPAESPDRQTFHLAPCTGTQFGRPCDFLARSRVPGADARTPGGLPACYETGTGPVKTVTNFWSSCMWIGSS